jgi:hypothetical protein
MMAAMAMTRHVAAVTLALAACSSGSKTSSSAAPSATPAPTATATSGSVANASAPEPSASSAAMPGLKCPDEAYRHDDPAYCIVLDRGGTPKPAQLDNGWMTTEIGPQAVLSYSKTISVDTAKTDLRKAWNDDFVKAKSHYEEKVVGDKTVIKFKHFDPKEDPNATEANDVLVVIGKSGDYTVRCEIDAGMTNPDVCMSLVLPPG